jgi:hypothetical protein
MRDQCSPFEDATIAAKTKLHVIIDGQYLGFHVYAF